MMMMSPLQLPDDQVPVLRMMPMPADANIHGDVFGGWIMAHVDIAGAIPAARRANGRVATVAVTSFLFKHPVFVGDLVSFYANIAKTGRTSITVDVEVYAERNRLQKEVVKVTEATLVYVATDERRQPRALPEL
ncbi:MAG TPA: acyl-CoA thioesterase [Burkholderiaceae bacterium]|nr:acyl-CoA thioesterase [Burkholderiaceae bacterium]